MPCAGAGGTCAVQFASITAQLMAVMAQLAALFAHFVTITDNLAVDGMDTAMANRRAGMGLGESRGDRGTQGEERGCQQKLAHRILLQTGSHPCDHR